MSATEEEHDPNTVLEAFPSEGINLLVGPKAIGAFLGRGTRATDRLIRLGVIPTFKFGGRATATRESLRTWIAANTERARAEHEARRADQGLSV